MPITGEDLAAVRAELHAPIEQLDLLDALDVRDFVRDIVHDPDELSDAERALVAEGEAQIDRGEYTTLEEFETGHRRGATG